MDILLHRILDNGIQTLGYINILKEDKSLLFNCKTLELPDKNNQKKISCIPKGTYDWEKVVATKKIPYEHISIKNVSGRDGICIHTGNYNKDILGCVIVGSAHIDINKDGQLDVVESKKTFGKMMEVLPEKGRLIIS